MRIWKYPLQITDNQTLLLPVGAKILAVQMQGEYPQLWALVDDMADDEEFRKIAIYGTGNPMPDNVGEYITTFQSHGGMFVWHVFEI
jgi:hypothetical protein